MQQVETVQENCADILADAIAGSVSVDHFHAEVLPEDKARFIKKEQAANRTFDIGFNSGLIPIGALGVLAPAASALLHNGSALLLSVNSMTNLLKQEV